MIAVEAPGRRGATKARRRDFYVRKERCHFTNAKLRSECRRAGVSVGVPERADGRRPTRVA